MFEYIWNEKEIMVKLNHPYIAKLHYALQNDKFLFLLMQYFPGGSLADMIRSSKLIILFKNKTYLMNKGSNYTLVKLF